MCVTLRLLILAFSVWGEVSPVAKARGRCLLLKGKGGFSWNGRGRKFSAATVLWLAEIWIQILWGNFKSQKLTGNFTEQSINCRSQIWLQTKWRLTSSITHQKMIPWLLTNRIGRKIYAKNRLVSRHNSMLGTVAQWGNVPLICSPLHEGGLAPVVRSSCLVKSQTVKHKVRNCCCLH